MKKFIYLNIFYLSLRREIGILTDDFRVLYKCTKILEELGKSYVILSDARELYKYPVILTTKNLRGENVVFLKNVDVDVRRAIPLLYGKRRFNHLYIGVDPGKTMGLAALGDGFILEKRNVYSISSLKKFVDIWLEGYPSQNYILRVGNGSPTERNEIIMRLFGKVDIEVVDERATSITKEDSDAAVRIARIRGRRIYRIPSLNVSDGEIRNIQRLSRIESNGKITISREMARKVILGEITLRDAIERALQKN